MSDRASFSGLCETEDKVAEDPVNPGLPALNFADLPCARHEFWPLWVFYLPVVLYCLCLSLRYRSLTLPLLANPRIPLGGMVGESKSDILSSAGADAQSLILPFVTFTLDTSQQATCLANALAAIEKRGFGFPLVAKPVFGCRGQGVSKVDEPTDLSAYLDALPDGAEIMLQGLAPYAAEAGVFYVREPEQSEGKVSSLTLKYLPYVVGDGNSTLAQLIDAHPRSNVMGDVYLSENEQSLLTVPSKGQHIPLIFSGSHCRGSVFRDACYAITPEMTRAIDQFMRAFPDFFYGRLDVKFASLEAFQRGQQFCVIEVNGVSSEATHIWDGRTPLLAVYRTLFWQYRTLFRIGSQLRKRGFRPPSIWQLLLEWIRFLRNSV